VSDQRKVVADKATLKKIADILGIEDSEVRYVKDYDADGKPSFAAGALVTPSHYVAQNAKGQECHVPVELVDPKATPAIPAPPSPPTAAPIVAPPAAPAAPAK